MEQNQKPIPLRFDTYMAMIEGSIGSRQFAHLFAEVNGEKTDLLSDGELSCAFYVSNILVSLGFMREVHARVSSTISDMIQSGWKEVSEVLPGAVIVWEEKTGPHGSHAHIGFCLNKDTAISNSDKEKTPVEHHITFGEMGGKPIRAITKIYWTDNFSSGQTH
jgi:hypothetical protein